MTDALALTVGMDMGVQQQKRRSSAYDPWFSPIVIGQVKWNQRIKSAVRVEYYQDEQGVIIATGTPKGFRTLGYSLNFDQWVNPNVLWRIEARSLSSEAPVFVDADGGPSTNNTFFTASIAFSIP